MAALACDTTRCRFGTLVTSVTYRSPDLLADMARTIDHLSSGRLVLGIGAGGAPRDHYEYGFRYEADRRQRLANFVDDLGRIRRRFERLDPPPSGPMPILIGGRGERMLHVVAQYADAWNMISAKLDDPVATFATKNERLDRACAAIDRDPDEVERTVAFDASEISLADGFVAGGAQHLIVGLAHPFDLVPAVTLLERFGR